MSTFSQRHGRGGFTLVELAFVIAIFGVLVSAAVPVYRLLLTRARASEARSVVEGIAHAELQHFRDTGRYVGCESGDTVPSAPVVFPNESECWHELGFAMAGAVRFRYSVTLDGDDYVVIAEGDQDRDGQLSRFTLRGREMQLVVEDELE